jgi:hypothetical protein
MFLALFGVIGMVAGIFTSKRLQTGWRATYIAACALFATSAALAAVVHTGALANASGVVAIILAALIALLTFSSAKRKLE